MTRLERVQKVTDVFDEGKIDTFSKRLGSITNEMDSLASKKQLLNVSDENLKKVLFALITNIY